MRGFRLLRVLLPFVIVLLVVGAVVAVLSARPDLESARDDVTHAWTPLNRALELRYTSLSSATDAVRTTPGPVHELIGSLDDALAHWRDLQQRNGSVADKVVAANDLESLGRRLVTASRASARVQSNPPAKSAVEAYAVAVVPAAAKSFNDAVRSYQHLRAGPARRLIAPLLGYDEISAYDTTGST